MRIALYHPEIAGNVCAILRTAACLGAAVDLIEPLGFPWDDKRVARAGMDYIDHVAVTRHPDWESFLTTVSGRIALFTTRGAERMDRVAFRPDDILLFGSEGAGAPDHVHARADLRVRVPIRAEVRSLNLSVSAGIALAEALRQTAALPA